MSLNDNSTTEDSNNIDWTPVMDDPKRIDDTTAVWSSQKKKIDLKEKCDDGSVEFLLTTRKEEKSRLIDPFIRARLFLQDASVAWRTIIEYSFSKKQIDEERKSSVEIEPGATRISCFFVRIRKKTNSLFGSISRMAERALSANDLISAAYCCVKLASRFDRIGIPKVKRRNARKDRRSFVLPSLLMIKYPRTPFCSWIRFNVSSTSA